MSKLYATLFLFFLAYPVSAQEDKGEYVGGKYRLWYASLSGDVEVDGSALVGTDISLTSDLGFGDEEVFTDILFWVNIPWIPILDRVSLSYWFGTFEESETLDETVSFGDQTFTLGTKVDSELELSAFTLTIETFPLKPGGEDVGVALGLMIGLKYFRIVASIEESVTNLSEREQLEGPLPILGVRGIVQITGWVTVEAEVHGIYASYSNIDGFYVEASFEAVFNPIEQLFIGIGYKITSISIEDDGGDTFNAELRVSGVYLTVGFRL